MTAHRVPDDASLLDHGREVLRRLGVVLACAYHAAALVLLLMGGAAWADGQYRGAWALGLLAMLGTYAGALLHKATWPTDAGPPPVTWEAPWR